MKKLVLLLLLLSFPCYSIETDKAAHLGTSYLIQSFTYGMSKKAFNMDKFDAIIFSAATTFLVGFTKEALDGGRTQKLDMGDMAANAAGQVLSIGTIIMFDF